MRFLRASFAVLALISLMAWVASTFLSIAIEMPLGGADRSLDVTAIAGRIAFSTHTGYPLEDPTWRAHVSSIAPLRDATADMQDLGINVPMPEAYPRFEWSSRSTTHPTKGWTWSRSTLAFPLWLPTVVLGCWPGVAMVLWIRRRHLTVGRCQSCGYDLRGSVSGNCPECGRTAANKLIKPTG